MLDVGDGDLVYWEVCGNPDGKPAVYLHGGPGSGCTPASRRFFDPDAYRIVLFDQRNCGRSRPHASDPSVDLANNTTANLVADIERLREHLGIERWLRVRRLVGLDARARLRGGASAARERAGAVRCHYRAARGDRLAVPRRNRAVLPGGVGARHGSSCRTAKTSLDAYHRLLSDPDAETRRHAAHEWCLFESATPDWPPTTGLKRRFQDPDYAVAFARIVTHYTRHNAFLEDGVLLRNADVLADTPGVLVNGRFDFQARLGNAWELKRVWPRAELVVVPDAGHGGSTALDAELVRATDRFRR